MQPAGRLHHSDQFQRHPERISGSTKITPTLGHLGSSDAAGDLASQQSSVTTLPKSPHVKRAKWHLGIRSQSRPGFLLQLKLN